MSKEDIKTLIDIVQGASKDIVNGADEWGETEFITVIDANDFINGLKELMDKGEVE